MLAKFAEDDRIEQMNASKRRMKLLEHKRAVERLMEERRRQFAAEREREVLQREEEQKMEQFRRQIIEEERRRLLREHATRLLGYLPKVFTFFYINVQRILSITQLFQEFEVILQCPSFQYCHTEW